MVPTNQILRSRKQRLIIFGILRFVLMNPIPYCIVETQKSQMELRYDQIFVISTIANYCFSITTCQIAT